MSPPKRPKVSSVLTADDGNEEEGQMSDGEGTTEAKRKQKATKSKPRQKKAHEAFVLLVDVGCSSAESTTAATASQNDRETDLSRSVQIVDWVLSRKIFTESTDHFSLMFFGHESTSNDDHPNVYVHNEQFDTARIEWLHVLQNEVKSNPKCPGNYVDALYAALDALKLHFDDASSAGNTVTGASVTLVSNLSGLNDAMTVMGEVEDIAARFRAMGCDMLIVGPDLSDDSQLSKSQQLGHSFAKKLLAKIGGGNSYDFREGLSHLKLFIPKAVHPRGTPFALELGKEFAFDPVGWNKDAVEGEQTQQLKKMRRYETVTDEVKAIKYDQIDQASDAAFASMGQLAPVVPSGRFIDKDQITRAFRYGTTIVPFGEEVAKVVEYEREGKQLQLLQFVRKENILPQFIMNCCRYILPAQGDTTAHTTISALCQAMIDLGVVALCRYAYNINSNPRMACLIPKISRETNYPVLIHYLMPFRDDFRYYDFPTIRTPLSKYQLDLMDSYIDALMLYDEGSNVEQLKKQKLHDPRLQYECQLLRDRAMHLDKEGMELTAEDRQKLLETLAPPKQQLDKALIVLDEIREEFPLELNENTRMAAFRTSRGRTEMLGQVDDRLQPIASSTDGKEMAQDWKRELAKKEEAD
uniref:Ku domain-containing protein n=1 Tax=Globodera rostochiensis TaxID=31243 RepID=A0A914HVN4_GLORO